MLALTNAQVSGHWASDINYHTDCLTTSIWLLNVLNKEKGDPGSNPYSALKLTL